MKKILLVIDEFGWAFNNHAEQISKRLYGEFDFLIVDRHANVPLIAKDFDLCFIFDPIPLRHGYPPQNKTIMSLRCQFLYEEHPEGAKGLYEKGFSGRCVSIKDKCKAFVVLNNNQYNAFKDIVGDKPLYKISHGVDETIFNKALYEKEIVKTESKNIIVGVVGRSSFNKGFDIVKNAVDSLSGFDFVHADYKNKITHNKMPYFYKGIDIYVCMSKSEAVNNGLLEAGAMGLPIISTNSGAAREIIRDGDNGFIVERNVEALAAALVKFQDKDIRLSMANKMYEEIVANWTWETKIKEYENMFDMYFDMQK